MTRKLVSATDLKMFRLRQRGSTHYFITPTEMKRVMELVGETGYYLYSYYRTAFFREYAELNDKAVGNNIGWVSSKVQRYRLALEKAELFLSVKYGTKTDGIVKVFVGEDIVALYKAGLPANVVDGGAFNKLKKDLNITNTEELLSRVDSMVQLYKENPEKY